MYRQHFLSYNRLHSIPSLPPESYISRCIVEAFLRRSRCTYVPTSLSPHDSPRLINIKSTCFTSYHSTLYISPRAVFHRYNGTSQAEPKIRHRRPRRHRYFSSTRLRLHDSTTNGATGYTGQLTAEHIASNLATNIKWAVAGRSESKLQAIVEDCKQHNADRPPPGEY